MITLVSITWSLISTMLFPTWISDRTLLFTNSVFSVLLFVVNFILLRAAKQLNRDKRRFIYTHILGFLLSFMVAAGHALDTYGSVPFRRIALSVIFYTHIIAALLALFWEYLKKTEIFLQDYQPKSKTADWIDKGTSWILNRPYMIMFFLLMCWLPCFIADFPGGFRYDATGELYQTANGYNGNYPLLHSVIITRLLPALYKISGSYNTGIAVYVILQMLMIAGMYTHILSDFKKKRVNNMLLLGMLLYCSCFPVIQILVVQEVRDVLFSALLMYTIFLFYLMVSEKDKFFQGIGKPLLLGITFVLALLSRNNNTGNFMSMAVLATSLLIWLLNFKKYFRGATIFSLTSIIAYLLLGNILTMLCQPLAPANTSASLSIMSQPLARAYIYERESWTNEDVLELEKYISINELEYCPENADLTKSKLNIQNNLGDFIKFWCRIGKKYPRCYMDAILANTQNMWYPDSIIDGYKQIFTEIGQPYYNCDKNYYSITANLESPAIHKDLWPTLLNFYTQIGLYISFEKIPVISMLFSIGFQFWIVLNCLFYILYRKLHKLVFPVTIILGYMVISAFAPLVLLRYFAAVFLSMPMLLLFTLQPDL